MIKKEKRVYFDIIVYMHISHNYYACTTHENISHNVGSFYINKKEIDDIDTKSICEYILKYPDKFFTSCTNKEKLTLKTDCYHLNTYMIGYYPSDDNFIYYSISNIHLI